MAVPPASEPAEPRADLDRHFLLVATAAGMAATALACLVLHLASAAGLLGPLSDSLFITPYWEDATAVTRGLLPYRDFSLEYPPASLVVFLLPVALAGGDTGYPAYRTAFEIVMAACAIGLVPIVVATVARLGGRRSEVVGAIALVALAPLLLGSLTISRYDLWPALLTAGATLAMLVGRARTGLALLALGALAKVYPAILAPVFLAHAWRTRGRREAIVAGAVGLAIGLAGLLPFVAIDPTGALAPFTRSLARPLQVESLGASIIAALQTWFHVTGSRVTYDFESFNLEGGLASLASQLQTIALIASLLGLWALAAWRPASRGADVDARFVAACAAVLAVTVAFGKVLSPQYVIWLVPAVAALAALGDLRPLAGLGVVLTLTQLYYPGQYLPYLLRFDPAATVAVLERNVGLVLIAAYLAAVTWRLAAPPLRRPGRPGDRAPEGA